MNPVITENKTRMPGRQIVCIVGSATIESAVAERQNILVDRAKSVEDGNKLGAIEGNKLSRKSAHFFGYFKRISDGIVGDKLAGPLIQLRDVASSN
jgi:hypothetical protein